jgi:hypothetical protein
MGSIKRPHRLGVRIGLGLLLGLGGLILSSSPTIAQIPKVDLLKDKPSFQDVESPLRDMKDDRLLVMEPDGKKPRPEAVKQFDSMAKWFAYRLATPPYNGENEEGAAKSNLTTAVEKTIPKIFDEIKTFLIFPSAPGLPLKKDNEYYYAKEMGIAMQKHLMNVIKNSAKPIVRINATRMLAEVAKMPYEPLMDSFLELLKDPREIEAVKLTAFEGLKNLLAHPDRYDPTKPLIQPPEKLATVTQVLIDFIEKKHENPNKDPQRDEVNRYIRREAIRALAQVHEPQLINRGSRKAINRPALTLLRIAASDPTDTAAAIQFVPPISLSERVEAAIGFCNMKADKTMNLAVAGAGIRIALVFLVQDQRSPDTSVPASIPWKTIGARWGAALNGMKKRMDELPASVNPKQIVTLADAALPNILNKIEELGITANPEIEAVQKWEPTGKIDPPLLYLDDPTTRVR